MAFQPLPLLLEVKAVEKLLLAGARKARRRPEPWITMQ